MEVKDSLPLMMNGTADTELVAKVLTHLAECPRCAEIARKMQQQSHAGNRPKAIRNGWQEQLLLASDVH